MADGAPRAADVSFDKPAAQKREGKVIKKAPSPSPSRSATPTRQGQGGGPRGCPREGRGGRRRRGVCFRGTSSCKAAAGRVPSTWPSEAARGARGRSEGAAEAAQARAACAAPRPRRRPRRRRRPPGQQASTRRRPPRRRRAKGKAAPAPAAKPASKAPAAATPKEKTAAAATQEAKRSSGCSCRRRSRYEDARPDRRNQRKEEGGPRVKRHGRQHEERGEEVQGPGEGLDKKLAALAKSKRQQDARVALARRARGQGEAARGVASAEAPLRVIARPTRRSSRRSVGSQRRGGCPAIDASRDGGRARRGKVASRKKAARARPTRSAGRRSRVEICRPRHRADARAETTSRRWRGAPEI